jgi:hypothetical protein
MAIRRLGSPFRWIGREFLSLPPNIEHTGAKNAGPRAQERPHERRPTKGRPALRKRALRRFYAKSPLFPTYSHRPRSGLSVGALGVTRRCGVDEPLVHEIIGDGSNGCREEPPAQNGKELRTYVRSSFIRSIGSSCYAAADVGSRPDILAFLNPVIPNNPRPPANNKSAPGSGVT